MKNLLAIIITSSLSFGCAMLEGEQTTTDSGGGGTTSAPTAPAPTVANWSGTKQLGTSSYDYAAGVATDSSGNVYVTGSAGGDLESSTSGGSNDLFILKYDSGGIKQWTKQFDTTFIDGMTGITSDASGSVYATGFTRGVLDGHTSISCGACEDFIVVKYDSSGTKQWTKQLGTSSTDYATGIATDSSGNVYVTGSTSGGLDGNTSAGSSDLFVVKYDSSGTKQWTRQLGSYSSDVANGIATDSGGNVYVTGYTSGGLDGQSNAGSSDLFIVKYDSNGAKQWTQQLGSYSSDVAYGIATNSGGDVYVTGGTTGVLSGSTNAGSDDLFVIKYSSSGVKQWAKQLGTSSDDRALGITSDSSGNVYITGLTRGGLDGNTNAGVEDLFVVKYDSAGVKQWTKQLGTSSNDYATGIATDSSGNVYVTGYTSGGLDGNTSAGSADLFIVKYDTNGNKQ